MREGKPALADHTASIDGQRVYYRTAGDPQRPHAIFLNGWGARLTGFLGSDRVLAELAQCFYVVSPELPGFMRSPPPPGLWDLEAYAHFLHACLAPFHLETPILIGQSFGGAFAATYALQYPHALRCLVLIDAFMTHEKNHTHRFFHTTPLLANIVNSWLVPLCLKQLAWSLYIGVPRAMVTAENVHTYLVMPQLQTSSRVRVDARELSVPLLLVWGNRDRRVTPIARARRLHAAVPTSRLVVVRGGHLILYRKPAYVIAEMYQGLRELLQLPPNGPFPPAERDCSNAGGE